MVDSDLVMETTAIYIGQVDYSTTPEELHELFSTAGSVSRVTIPGYPWYPNGYAYLEFDSEGAQKTAIETLNGADFKGRSLKVTAKHATITGKGKGGKRKGGGKGTGKGGKGSGKGKGKGKGGGSLFGGGVRWGVAEGSEGDGALAVDTALPTAKNEGAAGGLAWHEPPAAPSLLAGAAQATVVKPGAEPSSGSMLKPGQQRGAARKASDILKRHSSKATAEGQGATVTLASKKRPLVARLGSPVGVAEAAAPPPPGLGVAGAVGRGGGRGGGGAVAAAAARGGVGKNGRGQPPIASRLGAAPAAPVTAQSPTPTAAAPEAPGASSGPGSSPSSVSKKARSLGSGGAGGAKKKEEVKIEEVKVLSFAELMAKKRAAAAAAASPAENPAAAKRHRGEGAAGGSAGAEATRGAPPPPLRAVAVDIKELEASVEAALADTPRGQGATADEEAKGGEEKGAAAIAAEPGFVVGQRILGQWAGSADWYAGQITAVHGDDGTCDVLYDDGDTETRKDPALLMDASAAAAASAEEEA